MCEDQWSISKNANLQKGLQKLTFKYNDKLEYVFIQVFAVMILEL